MSDRLRVHMLIDTLTWGGAEMLLADLAAGAPSAGIELSVGYLRDVDGSPAAARLRERGVDARLVGIRALASRASVRAAIAQIRAARPDVVHTHLLYSDILGGVAAWRAGVPSVSTVHVMQRGGAPRARAKEALGAAVRRRLARRTIAVSDAAGRWLADVGWARRGRIVTVHNGVVAERRPGAGAAVREALGIPADATVALMLTVLRDGKGHDVAIAATEALAERFPALRLVIAGAGPRRAEIEAMAERLGERCVLTGHRDDVMELLDAADVLLHPSSVDAFPTALLEAMAAGVPVVSTRVGGIPEIVDNGASGVLLAAPPSADAVAGALAALLGDGAARGEMGARARRRFEERFTAEAWAARLRAVYEDAIAAPAWSQKDEGPA